MFKGIGEFNKSVWFMIISGFWVSFFSQMIWPFMALILYRQFGLDEIEVGFYLAFAVMVRFTVGFFVGNLSDRYGRRVIIIIGFLLSMFGMYLLGSANQVGWMLLGSSCISTSWIMVNNSSKALITDLIDSREVKDLALQLKFFFQNAAMAFGPAFGAYIGLAGEKSTFFVVSVVMALVALIGGLIFYSEAPKKRTKSNKDQSIAALLKLLKDDQAFMLFIAAYTMILVAYIQIQAGLLQYIRLIGVEDIEQVYANSLMINGMTIITMQFPLKHLMRNLIAFHRAMIGVSAFVMSYLIYATMTMDGGFYLYVAIFFLGLGEAILFPNLMIIMDQMAPEHLKGSYFGAAGINSLGVAAAPIIGGFLLKNYDPNILWYVMVFVSLMVGWLFYKAQHGKRPNFD